MTLARTTTVAALRAASLSVSSHGALAQVACPSGTLASGGTLPTYEVMVP